MHGLRGQDSADVHEIDIHTRERTPVAARSERPDGDCTDIAWDGTASGIEGREGAFEFFGIGDQRAACETMLQDHLHAGPAIGVGIACQRYGLAPDRKAGLLHCGSVSFVRTAQPGASNISQIPNVAMAEFNQVAGRFLGAAHVVPVNSIPGRFVAGEIVPQIHVGRAAMIKSCRQVAVVGASKDQAVGREVADGAWNAQFLERFIRW